MPPSTPLADTGFVVAIANRRDLHHSECRRVYGQYSRIQVPQTVLAESAYLIRRDAGARTVIQFLRSIAQSRFEWVALSDADLMDVATILDTYADTRIDFVDASIMALAERLQTTTILTLDRRDFMLYRPRLTPAFTLLP